MARFATHPTSIRDTTPTILQPLSVANGIVGNRAARLSDDSLLTGPALNAETPDEFVEQAFLQILGRPPSTDERGPLADAVRDGFGKRKTGKIRKPYIPAFVHAVSWSNHLNAEATRIKLELEQKIRQGDPPTETLTDDWRVRAEDVIWVLLNTPEFVFSP